MKRLTYLTAGIFYLLLSGCGLGPSSLREPKHRPPTWNPEQVVAESEEVGLTTDKMIHGLEKPLLKEVDVEPIMPKYDPLEDHIVSFSMIDEDLKLILYSLSQSAGMSLIMEPGLSDEKRLVTLNFEKVSAATVLKEILNTYDLFYEIDQNVIRIRSYEERFFSLNFLDTNIDMSFEVGGDVLGVGESESTAGLSGTFKLSGSGSKKANAYDLIEQMTQRIMTKGGTYTLNRLSGSLYVRDTPRVISAVSRLIAHFEEMLSRQIIIEARIVEVVLSDEYSYGIDWSILRSGENGVTKLNSLSWSLGAGLALSGVRRAYSLESAVDALRTFGETRIISNPSIRSKHAKPAIISVGTSFSYKKSVSTTTSSTSTETQDTTEVEVSTVFDGLILGIVPFIEADGRINLLINPIKSDVDPTSIEPVAIAATSSDTISLPKVSIKEISTTISLKSGDVIFLGGLIDKHQQNEKGGVPFFSSIPLLGYLFKNESMREETRELVIVLGVRVV
ncbi:MAG: pilus (MSHA type) biogenesis protein MshL [Thermodesulfobacteriota bacterium]|nr:pilus (MSHA type) biogenesis protein MshL [Thermodesulfobacteriota bacterium]